MTWTSASQTFGIPGPVMCQQEVGELKKVTSFYFTMLDTKKQYQVLLLTITTSS